VLKGGIHLFSRKISCCCSARITPKKASNIIFGHPISKVIRIKGSFFPTIYGSPKKEVKVMALLLVFLPTVYGKS
jgi:hypothetical protein